MRDDTQPSILIHIFQVVVIPGKPDVAQIFNLVGAVFPKPIALGIVPVRIAAVGNIVRNVVTARLFKIVLINTQCGSIEPSFMKFCKFDEENDVGGWLQVAQEILLSDISVTRRSHQDWVPRVCAMNLQENAREAASARARDEPISCHTSGGSLRRKGSSKEDGV